MAEQTQSTWYQAAARPVGEKAQNPAASPYLKRAKIQAEVLVPVLRAFRNELGEERANRIAWDALAGFRRQAWQEMQIPPGSPTERFRASNLLSAPIIADAVDVEMLKDEPEAIEFNVTGCRFAQFFRELAPIRK